MVSVLMLVLAASPTTHIVEAFRALPAEATHGYELRQKPGGAWVAYDAELDRENEATVDVKNGFIQVVNEGTGGGTHTLQVALFRTASGGSVVLTGGRTFDGVVDDQELKAFVLEGKEARPAPEVLQALPRLDELLPKELSAQARKSAGEYLTVLVDLPRRGTALTLHLGLSKLSTFCGGERKEPPPALCEVKGLEGVRRSVAWDRRVGRFASASK